MLSLNFQDRTSSVLLALTATTLFGFIQADVAGSKDLFRCRQSCYQKFVQDWHHCMDFEDCKNMCITPPNINSYIPEAFSFLCWNNCDQQLGPFLLNINSALRQGSLVLTDIGWDQAITNASKQCLVTWEVSGGGLMGNLLTDSSTVELSLWPETVYHVQVTCKHKETGGMRRSYKLIVDTHKLSDSTATGMQAIALDTGISKTIPSIYSGANVEQANSAETDSRMRILKDSSKDFLSPYNPNLEVTNTKSSSSSSSSSSTTSSSSTSTTSKTVSHTNEESNEIDSDDMSAVYSKKLIESLPHLNLDAQKFLTQSIVFAVVGSMVLFLGLLTLYILLKPNTKAIPQNYCSNDKEVLIRSEMLPSQTPAALQAKAESSFTPATGVSSQNSGVLSESRTLHV